ncbi:MAG: ABC transporter substrate-binding protein [Solirubrobacterales bacterium]
MRPPHLRWIAAALAVCALALVVAACGGGSSSSSGGGETSAGGGESTSSSGGSGEMHEVSFQLDWTPNTNHTGLYVADQKGYYEEAGIKLKILPYSNAGADTIIGAGKANCGITFQENVPLAVAAGTKEKAVMTVVQHQVNALITKKDSEFTSPKTLSGGTYGGFGLPYEVPMVDQMIEFDGGKGEVKGVTLNTGAYEAVYNGQVDTSLAFRTWELIEAKERGIELNEFPVDEYGVPDFYNVMIACNDDWLEQNPEVAKAFIEATAKGYEFAVEDPKAAAKILIDANPGVFPRESLVYASAEMLAKEFYDDEEGNFGCQTKAKWEEGTNWLFEKGIITGTDGKPVSSAPELDTLYSTEFGPAACEGSA